MNKRILLPFAIAMLVLLIAGNAFALEQCKTEYNFGYYALGERFNKAITYTNGGSYCGIGGSGDFFIINAVYKVKTSSNTDENKTTPLLKITHLKHNKDKLQGIDWSIDNDTWDFRFELLNPDGTVLQSVEKEIWESSSTAIAADRTRIDLSINGEILFHVSIDMDEDIYWPNGGQMDKLYIEAKKDIFEIMKILGGYSGEICIGSGCAFGATDSQAGSSGECPKELDFYFYNSAFVSKFPRIEPNKITYPAYYSDYGQASCVLNKNQNITVNAVYLEMTQQKVPRKVKNSLLRITMIDHYPNRLAQLKGWSIDNDTWKFGFELLNPDGTVLQSVEKEIWEYSGVAEVTEGDPTKIDIILPEAMSGEPAFHVTFNMDSALSWDGQLKIYIEAKPDVSTVLTKLAGSEVASTCPVVVQTDITPERESGTLGIYKNCNPGGIDIFEHLVDSSGNTKQIEKYSVMGGLKIFLAPDPEQLCRVSGKWSDSGIVSGQTSTECYAGADIPDSVVGGLTNELERFYNIFPNGIVKEYVGSVFVATNGTGPWQGYGGLIKEPKTFFLNYLTACPPGHAASTLVHEFAHSVDVQKCLIFGDADKKAEGGIWTYTGEYAKEFYEISGVEDYEGNNWEKVPVEPGFVSQYAQSNAAEDFAETSEILLLNNEKTGEIAGKAMNDDKLKNKILLVQKMWEEASNNKMNLEWWCENIAKLRSVLNCPEKKAESVLEALSNLNKKLVSDLGLQ